MFRRNLGDGYLFGLYFPFSFKRKFQVERLSNFGTLRKAIQQFCT